MASETAGKSPKRPMAEIPVAPGVKAHSIVSIDGDDQPPKGGDGVVKYISAHVDYVESEFIVRSYHTCLNQPATIEEVRRILHEHLKHLDPAPAKNWNQPQPDPMQRGRTRTRSSTSETKP